ncbi:conserved hypothetical protein [Actinomyces sp. oral taxon 180 str. F0310]|nr:conserved hypothetical protein [Actinomyces sp. oral taxon 180 str. F0310]
MRALSPWAQGMGRRVCGQARRTGPSRRGRDGIGPPTPSGRHVPRRRERRFPHAPGPLEIATLRLSERAIFLTCRVGSASPRGLCLAPRARSPTTWPCGPGSCAG